MKKVLGWVFRILCFAIIAAAAFTLGKSLLHMNDDHSYAALMADVPVPTFENESAVDQPSAEETAVESVDENPVVTLDCDEAVSVYQPYATLSAVFSNIQYSVVAELDWYVDDELVSQQTDKILVEGSSVSCSANIAPDDTDKDTAVVRLEVLFDDKSLSAETTIAVEKDEASQVSTVRTEEIAVTIAEDCSGWKDQEMQNQLGELSAGDTGLLLGYETTDAGEKVLKIQLDDSSTMWVDADCVQITKDNCTTDEDYSDAVKETFVNSMEYDSHTDYMVWVSLYTQKVNVFIGYEDNWSLYKTFDCATGVNETPTTTGTFTYSSLEEKWDLNETYVAPVMVFNGGEAFTSQPYSTETDTVEDDTMGEPASGGSVRMLSDDITWMASQLPLDTLIVVY